ncbi:histone acetyltransferase KNAG_0E01350 [Huiozyma naganishii CBS 8797]|uniref:Transcription initiation factor TFIID subunit 1 histone acetyltransferase domain-containing protein n=1 Tax=Huiozyma naganishii (strain ATCC MYA-139 / BCRC 22969 / CBS 8797 / KCTC 17520 / NBRC 10181 / NCYC 3082 / Yp74L-3) TaxID=1071383 RepID=J7S7L6_HUIN7|nr:hypothetical protein KNAG_0E01350 [Kazachstania naganishii CBS 8797]CCK70401.1 hypothetical protein KNAG_0E01350 [Kazachstania naganishii CBS 8797]
MAGSKAPSSNAKKASKSSANNDLTNEDEAYDAIFNGEFGSMEVGSFINGKDAEGATEHLPDAVDFEDEDELADEEDPDIDGPGAVHGGSNGSGQKHMTAVDSSASIIDYGSSHLVMEDFQNGNSMQDVKMDDHFSRPRTHSEEFMAVISHDERALDGDNLGANEDVFQNENNALFMGMDNTSMTFMDNTAASYDIFNMGDGQRPHYEQQQQLSLSEGQMRRSSSHQMPVNDEAIRQRKMKNKADRERRLLKYYFPDFKKGKIMKWNRCIYRKKFPYPWYRDVFHKQPKPLFPVNLKIKVQPDQKRIFNTVDYSTLVQNRKHRNSLLNVTPDGFQSEDIDNEEQRPADNKTIPEDLLIATDSWDQDKIIDNSSSPTPSVIIKDLTKNNLLDDNESDWDWDPHDLVDAKLHTAKVAELDMNDEKLLLLLNKPTGSNTASRKLGHWNSSALEIPSTDKLLSQKFNISNDHTYAILKHTHQPKIRATISNLNIEHSKPASNLQSPFYKVNLLRNELRFFHRPRFGEQIQYGSVITFNRLKTRKRKRDKGKDVKESFGTSQDLTVGDTAPVYLMEYSEQTPLALSKFGMANKLINYYRKTSEEDTLRPKLSVGETHVLGVQDKSPFWNFGFVEPGHIVPTLYNNMIRAPVFKHEVSGTDFLMVRSTGHGVNSRFFLRNINHLFTVGQTLPVEEIPGPNSRKVTSMRATRLRMIVYRILNRVPARAISIEPITKHFPDQDYGQNRQKIKEFMKYQRDGPDKGLWKLKEGEPLLDNENTKKLMSPEQISEVESMSHALQFMEDNENYNFDEKLLKLEEELLPWNITRNFINSTQMRAMVQIHGAGDPTGCGEGFSFLKTSMKGGFVRSNSETPGADKGSSKQNSHTYNVVQQQKVYNEEIARTWYTHAKSLSVTNPFEEIDDLDMVNPTNSHVRTRSADGKILRIIRKTRDANGIIQRQTVVIRDPRVIKGYLKGKERRKEAKLDVNKLLEEDAANINNLEELEMQKKLLQNELANLEKSQQRRAARQGTRRKVDSNGKVTKNKNTTRRCATCGQVGHIRTNKTCPMYNVSGAQTSSAALNVDLVRNSSAMNLAAMSASPGPSTPGFPPSMGATPLQNDISASSPRKADSRPDTDANTIVP